jgi:hypothetical protein
MAEVSGDGKRARKPELRRAAFNGGRHDVGSSQDSGARGIALFIRGRRFARKGATR